MAQKEAAQLKTHMAIAFYSLYNYPGEHFQIGKHVTLGAGRALVGQQLLIVCCRWLGALCGQWARARLYRLLALHCRGSRLRSVGLWVNEQWRCWCRMATSNGTPLPTAACLKWGLCRSSSALQPSEQAAVARRRPACPWLQTAEAAAVGAVGSSIAPA